MEDPPTENVNPESEGKQLSRWERLKGDVKAAFYGREDISIVVDDFDTESVPEGSQKSYEGLIFDDPADIQKEIGLEPKLAGSIVDTHLMDHESLQNMLLGATDFNPAETAAAIIKISEYRESKNLTHKLTKAEFIGKLSQQPSLRKESKQTLADLYDFFGLEGVDLANPEIMLHVDCEVDKVNQGAMPIKHIILDRVESDYERKRLDDEAQKQSPNAEKERTSCNVPLREVGGNMVENLRNWARDEKISPETRTAIQDFFKGAGKEGKEFLRTLKPKDHREITALTARAVADFAPGVGFGLMAANLGLIGIKEIKTGREIKRKVREEDPDTSAFIAYLSQTTIGKIVSKESKTGLSRKAKIGAGLTGAATSSAGMIAAEVAGEAAAVPGAKSVARAITIRSFLNYFGPRFIDFAASRAAKFESEEQKKEWVDLAIASSSATTTVLATGMTAIAFSQAGISIDTSKVTESLREAALVEPETSTTGGSPFEPIAEAVESVTDSATKAGGEIATTASGVLESAREGLQLDDLQQTLEKSYENLPEEVKDAYEKAATGTKEGVSKIYEDLKESLTGEEPKEEVGTPQEKITTPTAPVSEEGAAPEATPTVQEVSPNEYHFKDGSYAKYGSDGKPTEVVLADGRDLLFAEPEDSRGIMGIQGQLLEMHKGEWSPDEIAVAAQRLASEGVTSDQSDIIADYSEPEMSEVLGAPVEGKEIKFDTDGDGNPDAHWKVDKDGNIVGGVDSNGKELIFDVRGEGTPHLQKELANMHPDWNPDEVELVAYRDGFLKGINPNDPEALESVEKPTIETSENVPNIANLVDGKGFDEDGDGIEDSKWLKDENTGQIEAGILPDGRVLYLGEEGGVNGVMQESLVHENPNLSPEKVGIIAERVVSEHEINTTEKASGAIVQPEVISTVNTDVARFSLQDYLRDRFNLKYISAHELAFNKIKLDVRDDSLVKLSPGTEALDFLNARVEIETGIFNWRVVRWKDWLTEQGVLN
jgi:hypothetical protein